MLPDLFLLHCLLHRARRIVRFASKTPMTLEEIHFQPEVKQSIVMQHYLV